MSESRPRLGSAGTAAYRGTAGAASSGGPGGHAAGHWVPSPLLLTPRETPRFLRAAWDQKASQAFGPWRVGEPVDPALPVHELPLSAGRTPDAEGPPGSAPTTAGALRGDGVPASPGFTDVESRVLGEASPEALAEAQARGHAQGLEEGRAQALADVEAERAREAELIRHLAIELRALSEDPDRFFEPLRRLALHIAEQLVRGELQAAPQAITQIVRQALAALDPAPGDPVLVCLNPEDVAMLQAASPSFLAVDGLKVQADPQLHRGSVRLRMDDTVLEDLVEHRLAALVERLLVHPGGRGEATAVPRDSALLREFTAPSMPGGAEPLAAGLRRRSAGLGEVIDATARPTSDGARSDSPLSDSPLRTGPGEEPLA